LEERWRLAQASMAMDKSRIEELMNYPGRVVLLYEQIDAAWLAARGSESSLSILRLCGIVACEECGGSGRLPRITADGPDTCKCPSCHGHKWKLEEINKHDT